MIDVVALGVAGVLEPRAALWRAEIAAARAWLRDRSLPAADFLRAAGAARRAGHRAPIAIGASRSGLALGAPDRVSLFQAVGGAVPRPTRPSVRGLLRELGRDHRLAFVEQGSRVRLSAWLRLLGVADLAARSLCTEDLGHDARPPRPLVFRWLAERLGAPAGRCLYVAGDADLGRAARGAGWQVLDVSSTGRVADLESLLGALADPAGTVRR